MKVSPARGIKAVLLMLALAGAGLRAADIGESIPLRNWQVPARSTEGLHPLTDLTYPGIFIGITPCRLADTRAGSGFTSNYGPPAIAGGTTRSMSVTAGACAGLPSGAGSVSLNLTVTNAQGPGDLRVYPTAGPGPSTPPLVSTLNYVGGQTIANAAIVPVGFANGITIQADVSGTDLIVDMNGYFIGGFNSPNQGVHLILSSNDSFTVLEALNTTVAPSPGAEAIYGQIGNVSSGTVNTLSGVYGNAINTTGATYGVRGRSASTSSSSAGIYGESGSPAALAGTLGRAGVIGNGDAGGSGVLGVSQITGVTGALVNSSGVTSVAGRLGYSSYGVYAVGDFGGTGAKFFVEPHPEDPAKVVRYVCLEGPESGTYFRGRGRFVDGVAHIEVPESFRIVSDSEDLTVQITPIGRTAAVAVTRMSLAGIEAEATRDVEFSYIVHGVRKAFKDFQPIIEGSEFRPERPDDRMPAYLTGEAKRRLVANGTYNEDGTVNMQTAERMGWARAWREQAAAGNRQ